MNDRNRKLMRDQIPLGYSDSLVFLAPMSGRKMRCERDTMVPLHTELDWHYQAMLTMRAIKHFNYLGSAGVLSAVVLITAVLLLPRLGFTVEWKPKTTAYRLVNNPFIGWSLVVVLCAGLVLIRRGSALLQCATALVFVGLIFGIAITSALFWDAWLSPMLVFAALPIQLSAAQTLRSLVPSDPAIEATATGRPVPAPHAKR
ncbi:hypothetical protein [Rhodoferax sp. OV413]|uniref:hypothetical protein n=1 Tax=Rhodoferax sp. OV413 TaxID=1855285 RepID=UPI00115F88FA|nr:hypothetical protein [Rhodoferax sp. OV413]